VSQALSPITAAYDLTERDVVRARFWFLRRNRPLLLFGAIAIIVVGGYLLWAWFCGADLTTLAPFLFLLTFWVAFVPLGVIQGSRRFYRAMLDSERHIRMRFAPDHFDHEDGESSGRHSWRIVQSAGETPEAFYFLHRAGQMRVIPKRAFESPAVVDDFRALLRSVLGDRAKVAQGG
jgi:hypothetical protein